jgi:hypothetical protein
MSDDITLTNDQQMAFDKLLKFLDNAESHVFILKGYAGTGKTTLIEKLAESLEKMDFKVTYLASTGRAAKVMTNITKNTATTIHSLIYRFHGFNQDIGKIVEQRDLTGIDKSGQLYLRFDLVTVDKENVSDSLYIVDESSMISDAEERNPSQAVFGNGRLLKDLLEYDPYGKFIFTGDICQLPPIHQDISPALTSAYFKNIFGIDTEEYELTEVVRQDKGNQIARASKKFRELYWNCPSLKWGRFPFKGYDGITIVPDQVTLINLYINDIKKNGYDNSAYICFSNKSCDAVTSLIRPLLGLTEKTLQPGDLLLVTQNNISGLLNGDIVMVQEVGAEIRRAKLTFVNVSVKELSSNRIYSQLLIEDTLDATIINLSQTQQKELYIDFFIRMKARGIMQDSEEFKKAMQQQALLSPATKRKVENGTMYTWISHAGCHTCRLEPLTNGSTQL